MGGEEGNEDWPTTSSRFPRRHSAEQGRRTGWPYPATYTRLAGEPGPHGQSAAAGSMNCDNQSGLAGTGGVGRGKPCGQVVTTSAGNRVQAATRLCSGPTKPGPTALGALLSREGTVQEERLPAEI